MRKANAKAAVDKTAMNVKYFRLEALLRNKASLYSPNDLSHIRRQDRAGARNNRSLYRKQA